MGMIGIGRNQRETCANASGNAFPAAMHASAKLSETDSETALGVFGRIAFR